MPATVGISIAYGAGETVVDDQTEVNFQTSDDVAAHASNPITIPAGAALAYSYERYIKAKFAGTFTAITNVKIYKHLGDLPDGVNIKASAVEEAAYVAPVITASAIAVNDVPENDTDAIALTPAAGIAAPGYSKYAVMQMVVSSGASAQTLAAQTFLIGYDET